MTQADKDIAARLHAAAAADAARAKQEESDALALDAENAPPSPPPAAPAPVVAVDPLSGLVRAGGENDTINVLAAATGKYGANGTYASVKVAAGSLTINNTTMGGDPLNGVEKALFLPKASFSTGSAPASGPSSTPAPAAAPAPAAVTSAPSGTAPAFDATKVTKVCGNRVLYLSTVTGWGWYSAVGNTDPTKVIAVAITRGVSLNVSDHVFGDVAYGSEKAFYVLTSDLAAAQPLVPGPYPTGFSVSPLVLSNHLPDALPTYLASSAHGVQIDWPGGCYMPKRNLWCLLGGGHEPGQVNDQFVAAVDLTLRKWVPFGCSSKARREADLASGFAGDPFNDVPGDPGFIPHEYDAVAYFIDSATGKEKFIAWGLYGSGTLGYTADPDTPVGGWSSILHTPDPKIADIGVDPTCCYVPKLKGWFIADDFANYYGPLRFISQDTGAVDNATYPAMGSQYSNPKLMYAADLDLVIELNSDGLASVVSMFKAGDPTKKASLPIAFGVRLAQYVIANATGLDHARMGFDYVPGAGLCGCIQDSKGFIPVQITMPADPLTGSWTADIIGDPIPFAADGPASGLWGTHRHIADIDGHQRCTIYNASLSGYPNVLSWPAAGSASSGGTRGGTTGGGTGGSTSSGTGGGATPAPTGTLATMMAIAGIKSFMYSLSAAEVAGMSISDPKSGGALNPYSPSGGADDDIGLFTGDSMRALMSGLDPHAIASINATADCSVNWPIHVTDANGDTPAKPWLYPDASLQQGIPGFTVGPSTTTLTPDVAHQPHFLFIPALYALLTGDMTRFARYLSEMYSWLSWNYFQQQVAARRHQLGIYDAASDLNQIRGQAWCTAHLVQTYLLVTAARARGVKTDDGWYAWMKQSIEANIRFNVAKFIEGGDVSADALGVVRNPRDTDSYGLGSRPFGTSKNNLGLATYPYQGDGSTATAAPGGPIYFSFFMMGFLATVIGWLKYVSPQIALSDSARTDLSTLAEFSSRWPIGLFGDNTGYSWQHAGQGSSGDKCGTVGSDGNTTVFPPSFAAIYAQNYSVRPTGNAFLDHGSDTAGPITLGYDYVANIAPALWYASWNGYAASAGISRLLNSDQIKAGQRFAPSFAIGGS